MRQSAAKYETSFHIFIVSFDESHAVFLATSKIRLFSVIMMIIVMCVFLLHDKVVTSEEVKSRHIFHIYCHLLSCL